MAAEVGGLEPYAHNCLILVGGNPERLLNDDPTLGRATLSKSTGGSAMQARADRLDQFCLHIIEQLRTRLGAKFPRPGTPVQAGQVYVVDHRDAFGYRLVRVRPKRGIDPCVLRLWTRPRLYAVEAYLRCDVGQASLLAAKMGASRVTKGKPDETTFHSAVLLRTDCMLAPLLDEVCREIHVIGAE